MNVRRRWATIVLSALCLVFGLVVPASAQASITSTGPLTTITTTPDLNCAVNHVDDTAGEFYANTACGTFVALNGTLYGPASIPAGSALGSYTPYTSAGQTSGGGGNVNDPYRITTTVTLGDSGVSLTQVDTYVTGQASFRTDITLTNNGPSSVSGYVYRAADCYLANSDSGFGSVGGDGRIGCTNETRAEEFVPITGGSTYFEGGYSETWSMVATQQALPNTCRCDERIDNGMALAWNVTAVSGGSQVTVSTATSFGTSTTTTDQVEVVQASTGTSTNAQGQVTFNVSRPSTRDLTITIRPTVVPGCDILSVTIFHNGLSYPASDPEGDGTWTATIPRSQLAEADITYSVTDTCGTRTGSVGRVTFYDPSGVITDASTGAVIPDATVTLHNVPGWTAQTASNTGPQTCETVDTRGPGGWTQPAPTSDGVVAAVSSGTFTPDVNPQQTDLDGRYGWDVVTGCWYVTVAATGYAALTSPVVGVPPEVTDLDLALTPTGGTTASGVTRLAGAERIATANAISQDVWAAGSADVVLLARHDNFPDSLAGGPLAGAAGGPLLLTPSSGLFVTTAQEIMRVLPSGGHVLLLGGVAALSEDVAFDLMDLGYTVSRADGATRYETAVMVAQMTAASPSTIFIADGNTFGDALVASSVVPAMGNATVVLTAGTTLPASVADYLDANNGASWFTIGQAATAALGNEDASFVGVDVPDTSRQVAEAFYPQPTGFAIASSENFPDALAGSAHAGRLLIPLLLSPTSGMTSSVLGYLQANAPFQTAYLYGGTAALSDQVAQQAANVVG